MSRRQVPGFVTLACFALLALPALAATTWQAVGAPSGSVQLLYAGHSLGVLEPGLWTAGWHYVAMGAAKAVPGAPAGTYQGQLATGKTGTIAVTTTITPVTGGLHVQYRFVPEKAIDLNSLHINLTVPVPQLAGGTLLTDGVARTMPVTFHDIGVYSHLTRDFSLISPDQSRLDFHFAAPTPVLLQDDRQWANTFTLRIGPQTDPAVTYPAGVPYLIDMTLTSPAGMAFADDHPVTITAGDSWIPLAPTSQDIVAGSALDFTPLFSWHTPAGKFGRIIATKGGKFAFAAQPSLPAHFYGVNLIGTSQYLSHEEADRFAARLQRLGYNSVRLHHYEADLIDRTYTDAVHLNPVALDKLDYFAAALKARGIYITTDLYVSRPVPASEIWPGETGNVNMAQAVPVNANAYTNFLAFATALLTHVNPYTNMRWADDPTLGWLSLINEGNEDNFIGNLDPRLKPDWTRAWEAWLAVNAPAQRGANMNEPANGRLLSRFLADTDAQFVAKTREYLRQTIGCQALLTNLNIGVNSLQSAGECQMFDYVDHHFYVGHPVFLDKGWSLPSRSVTTNPISDGMIGAGRASVFMRLRDKPFTISEFNYAAPAPYRAVGGLLTGSLAAVQDWSVLWRFDYSGWREGVIKQWPMTYFDVGCDPLNQASDQIATLLFRRGDIHAAPHALAIVFTPEDVHGASMTTRPVSPGWDGLALVTQVGAQQAVTPTTPINADLALSLSGTAPASRGTTSWLTIPPYAPDATTRLLAEMRKRGWLSAANRTDPAAGIWQSETGEVTMNRASNTYTVETPRTVGGFAPAGGSITTKTATIAVAGADATVLLSSIDAQPIATSHRLLVFHLTEVQNSGATFADQACSVITQWGHLPYLVREGQATVRVRVAHPERAHVWGIAPDGTRLAPIAATSENGTLVIPLDVNANGNARFYYEIVIE